MTVAKSTPYFLGLLAIHIESYKIYGHMTTKITLTPKSKANLRGKVGLREKDSKFISYSQTKRVLPTTTTSEF